MDSMEYDLKPVDKENNPYFVKMEKKLSRVADYLSRDEYVVVPILGGIGSGKTSFLNAVKHKLEKEGNSVLFVEADRFLNEMVEKYGVLYRRDGIIREIINTKYLIIDDVDKLSEEEALKLYEKLRRMERGRIKIVIADRVHRGMNIMRLRRSIAQNRRIHLSYTPEQMATMVKERIERAGYTNRFTDEALYLMANKAENNLEVFFEYCANADRLAGTEEITEDVAKDAILLRDLNIIPDMDEVGREILLIVAENGKLKNGELLSMLKSRLGVLRTERYYEARRELEESGFLNIRRTGRAVVISSAHRDLGIRLTAEMVSDPILERERIEEKYERERGNRKKEQEKEEEEREMGE